LKVALFNGTNDTKHLLSHGERQAQGRREADRHEEGLWRGREECLPWLVEETEGSPKGLNERQEVNFASRFEFKFADHRQKSERRLEDEGDKVLDGDDYVGERVAAFREGSIRKGTVTECGKDEETGVIGWNIEFDDEDVVEYKDGDRGKDENFSLEELQEGIQLYEEEGFNETDN